MANRTRSVNPYRPVSSGPGRGYYLARADGWASAKNDFTLDEVMAEARALWHSDKAHAEWLEKQCKLLGAVDLNDVAKLITVLAQVGRVDVFDHRTGQLVTVDCVTVNGPSLQVNVSEHCEVNAQMTRPEPKFRLVPAVPLSSRPDRHRKQTAVKASF